MGRRCAALAAASWILFAPAARAGEPPCPGWATRPSATTELETATSTLCLINLQRQAHGLAPLAWNWELAGAAQGMAQDIAARHFFAHDTPDGKGLYDRVAPTGYTTGGDGWMLGENLVWGSGPLSTPLGTVLGWMNSPAHRENLFEPRYQEVGLGVAFGSPKPGRADGVIVVADFGRPNPPRTRTAAARRSKGRARARSRAKGAPGRSSRGYDRRGA